MFLLIIPDRDECGNGTELHLGEGGHSIYFLDWVNNWGGEWGGTPHTLLMRRTILVGPPHNIERKSPELGGGSGRVGWVGSY